MKKALFATVFVAGAFFIFTKNGNSASEKTSASTSIDGAWEIVWARYNDTVSIGHQFKMFAGGKFALFMIDSTGKLESAGYGKYELEGNSYKETFIYHNYPPFVGAVDWQTYEMLGDTLYMTGFNKVIVEGKEAHDFPKIEEKRVRVKW
jgi:hypothetical protein